MISSLQHSLEAAENIIKQHEAFITTMDANDEKINAVLQFASRLQEDSHYAGDKIKHKAEQLADRFVLLPSYVPNYCISTPVTCRGRYMKLLKPIPSYPEHTVYF